MSVKDRPNKLLVAIGGPTGVGKTQLTIGLAQLWKTAIVNADSRQVYNELNIGVGKPSPEQLAEIPHHLIGCASIFQSYTAGDYQADAMKVLESRFQIHDIVFLSGGTGLYIKALLQGFDQFPEIPADVVDQWTATWKQKGISELMIALEVLDPDYLLRVDKSNPMRLIRALAVSSYAGRPYSSFLTGKTIERPFNVLPLVLELPRKELYARIDQRVLDMISKGWLEEAKSLFPHRHLKALQTVGYKELFDVIDGKLTLQEAIPLIQQSTRRYAKRQMTWWRNQGHWITVSPSDPASIINLINKRLGELNAE